MNEKDFIKELNLKSFDTENGFYFTIDLLDHEIHGSFNSKEKQLENLINIAKDVFKNIKELNKNAKELIQKEYSDDDVNELKLDDLIFYKNSTFSLGYFTTETPAGKEWIYVKLKKDFTIEKELIYEYY